MPRTKSNNSKQNNLNYQSLYLWTSFLLGIISLGIIVWNRRPVVPVQEKIHSLFSELEIMDSHTHQNDRRISQETPRFARDESFVSTYQINFPSFAVSLVLSMFAYQRPATISSAVLFGLGPYIYQVNAQPTVPALTVGLDNIQPDEGIVFTGGKCLGRTVSAGDINHDGYVDLLTGEFCLNKAFIAFGPRFSMTNYSRRVFYYAAH